MGGGRNNNVLDSSAPESKTAFFIIHSFLGDNTNSTNYEINLQDGTAKLLKNKSSKTSTQNTSQATQITTLDNIIKQYNFSPNFIKIDTDGFDFNVIRGAQHTLKSFSPALIFEWDSSHLSAQNENPLSIFPLLSHLGYEDLLVFDNFGLPIFHLNTSDTTNLKTLLNYMQNSTQIYYFDILAFHKNAKLDIDELLRFCC